MSTIKPILLTCSRPSQKEFASFVVSYLKNAHIPTLIDDISICIDVTKFKILNSEYLKNLNMLPVKEVWIHEFSSDHFEGNRHYNIDAVSKDPLYRSIQFAAHKMLFDTFTKYESDFYLWIEDDVTLSSKFREGLYNAIEIAKIDNTGLVTLYIPEVYKHEGSLITCHENYFYGTQCILFTKAFRNLFIGKMDYALGKYPPGYDHVWSYLCRENGLSLRMTEHSYVQHNAEPSALHSDKRIGHRAPNFIP